jgi:amidase
MRENDLDALVMTNIATPNERNEFARDPTVNDVRPSGPSITDLLGVPEMIIPAGFQQTVYEPQYKLSDDKKSYTTVPGTVASTMANPMPYSIMFWGGPGDEPSLIKIASSYELASKHRAPPPMFPPLPGEP